MPLGSVPGAIELTNLDALGIGFTGRVPAITEPAEEHFNWTDLADYELFNVRYAVLPASQGAPPSATLIASKGQLNLFRDPDQWLAARRRHDSGDRHHRGGPAAGDCALPGQAISPSAHVYPLLTIGGQPAATPTLATGERPSSAPGTVSVGIRAPLPG